MLQNLPANQPDSTRSHLRTSAQTPSICSLFAETILDKCCKGEMTVLDSSYLTSEMLLSIRDDWFHNGGY